ncbi:diacylglycerol kinase (ATP) [Clostridiales Family XIII bacterium PM5-7]
MIKKLKKVILFYNPKSGSGMFKNNLDKIIGRCQNEGYMLVPIRAAHGHAIFDYLAELDHETYKEEYHQIIAAGGDGTINICVNAMIKNNIDLPLSIFPAGTANDFAYYFDMPNDIGKMLDIAFGNNFTYADVGRVNDRYFINVAAIGQVVDVSQKTDPALKNTIGVLAYYLKGLSEVPTMKPIKVTLTTPEKTYKEKMYFMVVMNGKSAGGFKRISPDSEINDGLLDVMLFRNMSIIEMPAVFMKILQGSHPSSRKVLHFQTSSLKIEADADLPTDIDGEHGEKFPLDFSVLHRKLRIHTAENNMGDE